MAALKIDLDTELSAVNSILGAIGRLLSPPCRYGKLYLHQGNNTVTIPELQFENPEVALSINS